MIQVNNIDVSYGPVQALHHVSVEISQDQAVAIIGSNGAGKTTLMNFLKLRNQVELQFLHPKRKQLKILRS